MSRTLTAGYCFCRTENVIIICHRQLSDGGSSCSCCRRLMDWHNKLSIGKWLDLSRLSKPVKLSVANGSEYGCWRLELTDNDGISVDSLLSLGPSATQTEVSSSSVFCVNCNCIVGQCSGTFKRLIEVQVTSLSLAEGFARVNILSISDSNEQRQAGQALANNEPALLALFPSTLSTLSNAVIGRTVCISNAHLYSGSTCQTIQLATNNQIALVIVAYAYTSLHCPELGWKAFHQQSEDNEKVENLAQSTKINKQHWLISRFAGESDCSAVIRLLAWSLTLQSVARSSYASLLFTSLCNALSSLLPPASVASSRQKFRQQLVADFIKVRNPLSNPSRQQSLHVALATSMSSACLVTPDSTCVIVIGQRLAFDLIGETLRLDLFSKNDSVAGLFSSIGVRLIHNGLFKLNLSARMTSLVAVKSPIIVQRQGSNLAQYLLVRLTDLVTSVPAKHRQKRRSRQLSNRVDHFNLNVTSCHSVRHGSFSVAGRLDIEDGNKHQKVLIEMNESASVLSELLLPSCTYRIVSDEVNLATIIQRTDNDEDCQSASPCLINLKRRPISVECFNFRQSDWLTPSRARFSGHLRLFALRGRVLDFSYGYHGNNDNSTAAGCHRNPWILVGDPFAHEELARVEFETELSNIGHLELLNQLAESDLWVDDILLLNVGRRQMGDGGAAASAAGCGTASAELDCVCADANPVLHLLSVTRSAKGRPPAAVHQPSIDESQLLQSNQIGSIGGIIEFSLPSAVETGLVNWFNNGRAFQLDCFLSAVCRLQLNPCLSSSLRHQTAPPLPLAEAFVLLQDGTQSAGLSCRGFNTVCGLLGFPSRFVDCLRVEANRSPVSYRRCWDDQSGGVGASDGSYLNEVFRYYLESNLCRRPVRLLVRLRRQPALVDELTTNDLLPRRRLPDVSLVLLRVLA